MAAKLEVFYNHRVKDVKGERKLTLQLSDNDKSINDFKTKIKEQINFKTAKLIQNGRILSDFEPLPSKNTNFILLVEEMNKQIAKPSQISPNLQKINEINDSLSILMSSGFPEYRCKKALSFNKMDTQSSLEWLLNNSTDASVDDELDYIEEEILTCADENICTYSFTKTIFYNQFCFTCVTCSENCSNMNNNNNNDGQSNKRRKIEINCCVTCAYSGCHEGHEIIPVDLPTLFFCLCSFKDSACHCLPPN